MVLSQILISFLILESDIQINSSNLRKDQDNSSEYLQVFVDVSLFNPGRSRGTTIWVEIFHEPSNVSFSKTKYIQLDYKELKNLSFDFILDHLIYDGNFTHKVWLTYPSSQD